jgi:hypothetical protein
MTDQQIHSAINQLYQSERGRNVLPYLFGMLNSGGAGLDAKNQCAVFTILEGAWMGHTGTVLDALRCCVGADELTK